MSYHSINVKTSENDVKYSSFNMGEMNKSRVLYSKEGDNSSRFEGKTVPCKHTIYEFIKDVYHNGLNFNVSSMTTHRPYPSA